LNYFKQIANKENAEVVNPLEFESLLDGERESRIAVVMPQSAGDVLMINSLMSNLKSLYKSHDIYVLSKPAFHPLIEDNPNVYKVLPYQEGIDDLLSLEGRGDHKGYFDIAFLPHIGTQKIFNYQHNGKDKTQFSLYSQ
jgi:ADP-heptose:LPS heptosyltransferase